MANPNPFLFGAPPMGGAEPPNPFLSGQDPSAAANPFGGMPAANPFGGMAAPVMHQVQPQYGAFGTPQPTADASNPFASFGAPTAQPQNSLFGDTSAYYQQQQPQHQQFYGQHGQYSQVTAANFSQPNVVASVQSPPAVPQRTTDSPKYNPFATAIDTVPFDQTSTPTLPTFSEPTEKPVTESLSNQTPVAETAALGTTEVVPNSQEEIPPPPPLLMQEDVKILPEPSTDEALPPPPVQESIPDDEPLPPPPVTSEGIEEASVTDSSAADIIKTLDDVHIDTEKVPDISVDSTLANETFEPSSKSATEQQPHKGEESGFSGIFTNELLDTGETIKATVSTSELVENLT